MLLLGFFTGDGARIDLPDGLAAFDWYFAIWTRLHHQNLRALSGYVNAEISFHMSLSMTVIDI